MPNNTNTPFTWTDAQWLNTQVTNCVDRSTEAVAIAAQALALINNINKGEQLLSKTVGLNLNPGIVLTYTALANAFTAGSTITDVNGSTAIILTDNGMNSMTLTSISLAQGFTAFSGIIKENPGSGAAVVNTFDWGDQAIDLTGGHTFIITNVVLTNASAVPMNVMDAEWWSGIARTGTNYANTISTVSSTLGNTGGNPTSNNNNLNVGAGITNAFPLANANQYMSITNGEIIYPVQTSGNSPSTSGSVLYFTVSVPEGTQLSCDMYIYGYVLN